MKTTGIEEKQNLTCENRLNGGFLVQLIHIFIF